MINTKEVTERRELRFNSIDECLAEIERVAAADREGKLQTLGNWTAGQNLAHLASWIEYGYDGYPPGRPPLLIRLVMRWMLPGMLKKGMSAGVDIPGVPGGTFGMDEMETQAAVTRLKNAVVRLKQGEEAKFDSPAFGPMSHERRVLLNLRHAELHLGFLRYE